MSDPLTRSRRVKAVALLGAGAVAGIIGAATLSANAASSSSSTSTARPPVGAPGARGPAGHGMPGMPGGPNHGPGETLVTGAKAATLRTAALARVPGGTVQRIETDSGDAAYEVHMTTSSGRPVTVKFDRNLAVLRIESGMGK